LITVFIVHHLADIVMVKQTLEINRSPFLEGLSGSCLMIPCTFSINISFDQYLIDNCVAIWNTGGPFGQTVFNSGLTGQSTNGNILQGNLTGNLRAKNCTTVFHTMLPQDKNTYYFRVQCNNKLKYSFPTNATIITITDSLPKPAITPPPVEVEEGDPVRLECSAVAPCPLLPPALTWTPAIGDVEENQQSASVSSVLNFTASRLYNGQRLQCSAFYRRQAGHSDLQYENNLTLRILYPPNNTSVSHSGPVIEGTSVNLTCNTDANPAVDEFTWYKVDGGQVVAVGFHALLSTNVSEADSRFFCQVSNRYGSQNSSTTQIDVQCESECDRNTDGKYPPSTWTEPKRVPTAVSTAVRPETIWGRISQQQSSWTFSVS
uniref:Uncharacterized protein n=1 Tax=Gasterosteus aculeatus aculeatus TaxID=481459 RepID=G3PG97_GASAC